MVTLLPFHKLVFLKTPLLIVSFTFSQRFRICTSTSTSTPGNVYIHPSLRTSVLIVTAPGCCYFAQFSRHLTLKSWFSHGHDYATYQGPLQRLESVFFDFTFPSVQKWGSILKYSLCMGVCLGGEVRTGESTCVVAQLVLSQEGKRLIIPGSKGKE